MVIAIVFIVFSYRQFAEAVDTCHTHAMHYRSLSKIIGRLSWLSPEVKQRSLLLRLHLLPCATMSMLS